MADRLGGPSKKQPGAKGPRDPKGFLRQRIWDTTAVIAAVTVSVGATQAGHTASATLAERFVTAATATQAPATAAATIVERFRAAVSATQSPATAGATLAERFSLAAAAMQAPARAAAAVVERFSATATTTQAPATASATVAERFSAVAAATQHPATALGLLDTVPSVVTPSIAVAATQSPHVAAVSLDAPAPFVPSATSGGSGLVGWRLSPPVGLERVIRTIVLATQSPHSASAAMSTRTNLSASARQNAHTATASVVADPFSDDELLAITSL